MSVYTQSCMDTIYIAVRKFLPTRLFSAPCLGQQALTPRAPSSIKGSRRLFFFLFLFLTSLFARADVQVVTEELPPYNYTEQGVKKGISTEVIQEMLNRLNLDPPIHFLPWARAYQTAMTTENTLIYSIARGASRELHFQWVGQVAPYQSCLFKLATRDDIKANTIKDARKYVTGAMLNSSTEEKLVQQKFVPGYNFISVSTQKTTVDMLMKKHIDFIAGDKLAILHLVRNKGLDPHTQLENVGCLSDEGYLYLAFSINTPKLLVDRFTQTLKQMKDDGSYQNILSKYL